MVESFNFELVLLEWLLVFVDVMVVVILGIDGEMIVMVQYVLVMMIVKVGVVKFFKVDGVEDKFVVFGGFVDILLMGCMLFVEFVVYMDELNVVLLESCIEVVWSELVNVEYYEYCSVIEDFIFQLIELCGVVLG